MAKLDNTEKVACGGFVAILLGSFMPAYSAPIIGGISMFSRGEGLIVVAAAAGGLAAAYTGRLGASKIWCAVCLVVCAISAAVFQMNVSGAASEIARDMAGNPFAGIGQAMIQSVGFSWAWTLLVPGLVAVFLAESISDKFLD